MFWPNFFESQDILTHLCILCSKQNAHHTTDAHSVQFSSVAHLWMTLSNPMDCSTPGSLVYHQLPVCSNSCPLCWWCHPTISSSPAPFSSCLQSFPASKSLNTRWPKYWSFSFSINPSSEYSGLISLRIYRFDLLLVEGTLKTLLQHHNSKASILWHSLFFMVRFS